MRKTLFLLLLVSCSNPRQEKANSGVELLSYLEDKTEILSFEESEVNGKLENENVVINYHSVSKNDFISAIKRNEESIRFFRRDIKINEYESSLSQRYNQYLRLQGDVDHLYLVDIEESSVHRARNFFLEGEVGGYYVIKRIQFEDAETILYNLDNGKEVIFINGISASISDSLLVYTGVLYSDFQQMSSPFTLLKINDSKIDTVIHSYVNWCTNFSFFDKSDSSIYYIHHQFNNDNLESTYAKMEYCLKN